MTFYVSLQMTMTTRSRRLTGMYSVEILSRQQGCDPKVEKKKCVVKHYFPSFRSLHVLQVDALSLSTSEHPPEDSRLI